MSHNLVGYFVNWFSIAESRNKCRRIEIYEILVPTKF